MSLTAADRRRALQALTVSLRRLDNLTAMLTPTALGSGFTSLAGDVAAIQARIDGMMRHVQACKRRLDVEVRQE